MKHFIEARTDVLKALKDAKTTIGFEKACLIVDLTGRCRALVSLAGRAEPEDVRARVADKLSLAADVFWGLDVWVENQDSPTSARALFEAVWREARAEPAGQEAVFVLDRRLSKDAWTGMPFDPPWPLVEGSAPAIVSFYSFRGGVGRTTLLLATAVNLARAGQKVVIVDFDLEAPGAGGLAAGSGGSQAGYGVVDYLLEKSVVPGQPLNIREYSHLCDDLAIVKNGQPIAVVPAGCLDPWYLEKLARINYGNLYRTASEVNAPRSPLHDLLRTLRSEYQPDVILVDSRSGLHDLGGLSLSGLAHLQVLMGLNSEQSWAGLNLAVAHLGEQMVLAGKPQRDCTIVHSMVTTQEPVREDEVRRFKEQSFAAFSENYYDPADAQEAEWPLPDMESRDEPHYPLVMSWDSRVMGYKSLTPPIVDFLTEGEFRAAAEAILAKVGRVLE